MKPITLFLCFLATVVRAIPTKRPTPFPTPRPTSYPTERPTIRPSLRPTSRATEHPTKQPAKAPAQAILPETIVHTRSLVSPAPIFFPTGISFPTVLSHSIYPSHAPSRKPTFPPAKCSLAVDVQCTLGGSTLDCSRVYSVVTASNCSNIQFNMLYTVINTGTTSVKINSLIDASGINLASYLNPNTIPAGKVSQITELLSVNVCDKVDIKFNFSASAQIAPSGLSCSASTPFALALRAPTRMPTARPSRSMHPSFSPSRSHSPSRSPSTHPSNYPSKTNRPSRVPSTHPSTNPSQTNNPSTSHFPSLPPTCNDTVWAKADSTDSQCFVQSASNVNQRGWTNLINGIGTTNLTLYAATGGCDTADRARLGSATVVTRSAGNSYFVTITLKAANRVYLTKAYLYAGQTFLPMISLLSFSSAPSAFTVKFEPTRIFQSYTNNITVNATLPFYVAIQLEAKYIC